MGIHPRCILPDCQQVTPESFELVVDLHTTMHRCLCVSEILTDICVAASEKQEDRSSLASLAQTCACFYEPAMDVLWRKLDRLDPLWMCLPDAPSIIDDEGAIRDPATLPDTYWDRLLRNAARVRTLHICDEPADSETLEILATCFAQKVVFPSLQSLHWNLISVPPEDNLHAAPLLGGNLITLSIECRDNDLLARLLTAVQECCRGLHQLKVTETEDIIGDSALLEVLDRSSMSFPSLQSLFFWGYRPSSRALTSLSRLPALRVMEISLGMLENCNELLAADGSSDVHIFPTLEKLYLYSTGRLPTLLLCKPRFPRLRDLTMSGAVVESAPSDYQRFFKALPSSYGSLVTLHLAITPEFVDAPISIVPLFELHQLKVFTIYELPGVHLPQDYAHQMVSAWPMMEYIEFSYMDVVIDLTALRILGRGWKHLQALLIDFDASDAAIEADEKVMLKPPSFRSRCERLGPGDNLQSPVKVAARLSDTFSDVKFLGTYCSRDRPTSDKSSHCEGCAWTKVEALLPAFAEARDDERRALLGASPKICNVCNSTLDTPASE